MIETLHKQADELQTRVQRVAEKVEQFQQTNVKLKDEVNQLRDELKKKNTELKQTEERVKTVSVVQNIPNSSPTQVKEMKHKLNEYIREIDRCINKLNAM